VRGVRRYVGARLHRQLFVAFAVGIVATAAIMGTVFKTMGAHDRWGHDWRGLEGLTSPVFASVWHDDGERSALALAIATELAVGLKLIDSSGTVLNEVRFPSQCRWARSIPIHKGSVRVGAVHACLDVYRAHRPWVPALAIAAALLALWLIAGLASRRITRPLQQLTRTAREIGNGNLKSRVRLRHGQRGEVGELTTAINDMASRIEAQIRAQKELLAVVSHELRTPLSRARVLLGIAREKHLSRDIVEQLDSQVVEMDELVGDLLANARLDFEALSLRDLDVAELMKRAFDRASLEDAHLEVPATAGHVSADATLVARALSAMLDNARKHGSSPIVLSVVASDDHVIFEVRDSGRGFEPGDQTRAFDAFYRGRDRPHDEVRGVGLGLAMVRRIAHVHGGSVQANNTEEGGARVSLKLPRRRDDT
jgi:two-component system, OmpR family, sensor kinase